MSAQNRLRHGWGWALGSVVLVSCAQLSLKYGMQQLPGNPGFSTYTAMFEYRYWAPVIAPIAVGLVCYATSVLCWLSALARLPLSLAYPLLSLSYLLVYLGAILLPGFNETANAMRLTGVVLVCIGAGLIAWPSTRKDPENAGPGT
ncbi:MAG: 4-amino-4-deoxy-L-arabinose-phosphoundecaprenol flippase subunit ArnF [Exilibacterium sp.]